MIERNTIYTWQPDICLIHIILFNLNLTKNKYMIIWVYYRIKHFFRKLSMYKLRQLTHKLNKVRRCGVIKMLRCHISMTFYFNIVIIKSFFACTYFMNTDQQSGKFKFISDVSGKKWLMYVRTKKFAVG
jgi:hypothetical protein